MTPAIELRHALHAHPELSGYESATARRIAAFFEPLKPDEVLTELGGHGVAFVFEGTAEGPSIMLRCELDALPVSERCELPYGSRHDGVSHKCGHDGHMAILAEVGRALSRRRPRRGRVTLLYQPAEETGSGARAVVADPQFARIRPDRVFGLHNVPGYPRGRIIVRDGTFSCASRGLEVRFEGRPAHAAQPETGASPAAALAELMTAFAAMPDELGEAGELRLITIVGVRMGGPNYGVSPGAGELHATLRAESDATMARIVAWCEERVQAAAARSELAASVEYHDVFDATVNARSAVATIREACRGLDVVDADEPFRWSEDFGRYTQVTEGAFFGLGAGTDMPDLHNHDYDFPDALVAAGADVFLRIVDRCLGEAT